jgi:cysteine synthase
VQLILKSSASVSSKKRNDVEVLGATVAAVERVSSFPGLCSDSVRTVIIDETENLIIERNRRYYNLNSYSSNRNFKKSSQTFTDIDYLFQTPFQVHTYLST